MALSKKIKNNFGFRLHLGFGCCIFGSAMMGTYSGKLGSMNYEV